MWKILVCLMVLVTVWQGVAGAPDDEVLTGYLVLDDDTKCLGIDGVSVGSPASTSQTDLESACIKLYLVEGSGTQKYKIIKQADQTMKLKLVVNLAPAFVDNLETEVQFTSSGSPPALVTAATAGSVTSITTKADAFIIQIGGATVTDAACLTDIPDYKGTTCGLVKWYFIAVCKVADCDTCADALLCDTCVTNKVTNDDKSACEACKDNQIVNSNECADCATGKTPNAARDTCVDACSDSNCKFCDSGKDSCGECKDGYKVDGGKCEGENGENVASNTMPIPSFLILAVITGRLMA